MAFVACAASAPAAADDDWEVRAEPGTRARGIAVAPDAGVYFLVDQGNALSLRRLALDGSERWRVDVPGALGTAVGLVDEVLPSDDTLDIVQGTSIVCVAPSPRYRRRAIATIETGSGLLACFDAATGTPWLTRSRTPAAHPIPGLAIDGDVVTWFEQFTCASPCRSRVERVTSERGRDDARRVVAETTASAAAVGIGGRTWLGRNAPATIVAVDASGNSQSYARAGAERTNRVRLRADGSVAWEIDGPTPPFENTVLQVGDAVQPFGQVIATAGDGRAATVSLASFDIVRTLVDGGRHDVSALKVYSATGALRWDLTLSVPSHTDALDGPAATLVHDERLGLLLDTVDSAGQPIVNAYRLGDGRLQGFERLRCSGSARCATRAAAIDATAGAYAIAADATGADGTRWAVVRWIIPDMITLDPEPPVAQPGRRGFWFARETPGQGFTFDVAGNAVFGSWFAFDDADRADWYIAQGEAPAGATIAALKLYSMRSPPVGTQTPVLTQVGQARLALVDCNTAKLTYALDPRAGTTELQSGAIVLDRSVTRSFDCAPHREAQPPQVPQPPAANGFERGQTGAWLDATLADQGIVLDVRPASASDPGHVVGAWYLPRGEWFTVQALVGDATNGRIDVPLYRSVGGARDRRASSSIERVGTATIDFDGCERATFDYAFDDVAAAGSTWRGKTGRWNLTRVTPCATD